MESRHAILAALSVYAILMLVIGLMGLRRNRDGEDFFLGGRKLGPWLAALSQGATQSSAWTLIGVSGAAYMWGGRAAWIWVSVVAGYVVNWFWVAPRLRRLSVETGAVTLVQLVNAGAGRAGLRRVSSLIILVSFLFYVAAQFQAAGQAFAVALDLPVATCILIGAVMIVGYTLAGGFWAAAATDFVQGILMLAVAVVLPVAAWQAAGGVAGLAEALQAGAMTSMPTGLAGLAFVAGTLGIGLAAPGQPHVVNHFMAARDEAAIRQGAFIAVAWIAVVLGGMLVVGWSARALIALPVHAEGVLYEVAQLALPPLMAGVVTVAVMSAIMSTVDSQLITATSSLTIDRGDQQGAGNAPVSRARLALLGFSAAAVALAIFAPESIYSRVLFAWNALGAAFGPLVILLILGRQPPPRAALAAMLTGFGTTVLFYLAPDAPGDWLERILPFFLALAVCLGWRGTSR